MIKELEKIGVRLASCRDTASRDIDALTACVKRLTIERDAAISDLREVVVMTRIPCAYCRYKNASPEEACMLCRKQEFHCWEWRGAREANNE